MVSSIATVYVVLHTVWNSIQCFNRTIELIGLINTKTRFAVYVVEILYENIPLTEMLSSLKVAKKYMHVYYFHGKHFTCWYLRGMLEADNFGQ